MTPATPPVLRTPRLELRPLAFHDAAEFHRLLTHPAVRLHLLDDEVMPLEWVQAEIVASQTSFRERGYGIWALRAASGGDGAIVGFAGFRAFHDPPEVELLYGLHPDLWGRGLATEAAAEVIRYGFDTIGFERVSASTDAPNRASMRVMERLGMRFLERKEWDGLDTISYVVERGEWLRPLQAAGGAPESAP